MTTNHTEGPWTIDTFPDYVDGTPMEVLDADNFPVATIEASPILNRWNERYPDMGHWGRGADDGTTQRNISQDELTANAHLIAAAPELLAALESIQSECRTLPDAHWDLQRVITASMRVIAKAKGEA